MSQGHTPWGQIILMLRTVALSRVHGALDLPCATFFQTTPPPKQRFLLLLVTGGKAVMDEDRSRAQVQPPNLGN